MTTTRAEFDAARANGPVVTVLRSVFVDSVSPVALYEHLTDAKPGTFLLESAEQGGIWSRYSFIGVSSWGCLTESDGATRWIDYGLSAADAFGGELPAKRLDALDALYARWASPVNTELPPLTSGLVGFLGWDTIRELENLPSNQPNESGVPAQAMVFVRDLLVLDHRTSVIHVCTAVLNNGDAEGEWAAAQERLSTLVASLDTAIPLAPLEPPVDAKPQFSARTAKSDFLAAVERSKHYIREGDVFQVVVSQRFDTEVSARAVDVYRMLRALNPSPYMYLLALETAEGTAFEVVGSSPEALVKVEDGRVFSHPIAGSRPRGATPSWTSNWPKGYSPTTKSAPSI